MSLVTFYHMPDVCKQRTAIHVPRKGRAPSSLRLLGLRAKPVLSVAELGLGFVVSLVKVGAPLISNVLRVGSRLSQ